MSPRERVEQIEYSHMGHHWLVGVGMLLLGIAALVFVLWLALADVKATPFDADGVRCYKSAQTMACIKTAEPAR